MEKTPQQLFEELGVDQQPIPRVDDAALEVKKRNLPETMREDFVFLGVFFRENCAKDYDLLVDEFKKVGVYHEKTTWAKILRGQWNRDSQGKAKPSPTLALEKFLVAIESLRTQVRAEAIRGKVPFIPTTTTEGIFSFIDRKRARDRVNKFGIIVGPTGSQKTATLKEYQRRNNHGACRWMEAPENGSMFEFLKRLSVECGFKSNTSGANKRSGILESFDAEKTLLLDNAQELFKAGEVEQRAFSFLRRLQDETGCTVILSVTPTFEKQLLDSAMSGYFEQFIGRAGGTRNFYRLPDYAPAEDILAIAAGFGLKEARNHLKLLTAISREPGRIRRLFEDLQEAKREANAAGGPMTVEHIHEVRGEES